MNTSIDFMYNKSQSLQTWMLVLLLFSWNGIFFTSSIISFLNQNPWIFFMCRNDLKSYLGLNKYNGGFFYEKFNHTPKDEHYTVRADRRKGVHRNNLEMA